MHVSCSFFFFFFTDTATTQIYTLSLHDALPISASRSHQPLLRLARRGCGVPLPHAGKSSFVTLMAMPLRCRRDRKSTRLNSSHVEISYAVFCLKKKKRKYNQLSMSMKSIYSSYA